MRVALVRIAPILALLSFALLAQESEKPATAVPRLVRITNTFHPANGLPVGITESVTLSVYREEQGGTPLWEETQNVTLDSAGHYTAMLGSSQKDGVPVDLFSTTEPRWLGVRFNRPGETEQARVQLVSVPYALKASDAETLGGRPASAFLLAPNTETGGTTTGGTGGAALEVTSSSKLRPRNMITGTMNYIPYFTDNSNDLGNSLLYQSGANVGIGTTSPITKLDVAGATHTSGNGGGTDTWLPFTDNNFYFRVPSSGFVTFDSFPSYTSLMRIGGNGSVGIGTTNFSAYGQTAKLAVNGYSIFGGLRLNGSDPASNTLYSSSTIGISAGGNSILLNQSGGNVGIGTTMPTSKLDVAGDINLSGSVRVQGSTILRVPNDGTGQTALGIGALSSTGQAYNTAIGNLALHQSIGGNNTAVGYATLPANYTGADNTAIGADSLDSNTTGLENTAVGVSALGNLTTGFRNTAIGFQAGYNTLGNGSYNIHIGNAGGEFDNSVIRIGDSQTSFFAAGIRGVTTGNGDAIPVVIDSNGQLGTVSSSRRYKEDIQDMADASNGLMRLRPVTFRYQKPFADGSKPIQYGLIAEEVAEVYPDLIARSTDGQIETVKYQVLDSMLLNEVQKQQTTIHELQVQNRDLHDRLARLEAAMEKMVASGVR